MNKKEKEDLLGIIDKLENIVVDLTALLGGEAVFTPAEELPIKPLELEKPRKASPTKKEEFVSIVGQLKAYTEKAILVKHAGIEDWIPFSQIETLPHNYKDIIHDENDQLYTLSIAKWIWKIKFGEEK